jgi:hypothetical protein
MLYYEILKKNLEKAKEREEKNRKIAKLTKKLLLISFFGYPVFILFISLFNWNNIYLLFSIRDYLYWLGSTLFISAFIIQVKEVGIKNLGTGGSSLSPWQDPDFLAYQQLYWLQRIEQNQREMINQQRFNQSLFRHSDD